MPQSKSAKKFEARPVDRSFLEPKDVIELRRWIAVSGIECVARVAAALTDPTPGNVAVPLANLLIEMAALRRYDPRLTTHAAAVLVAQDAQPSQRLRMTPDSLTKRLERDFARNRARWAMAASANQPVFKKETSRPASKSHNRALGRIISMLPTAIDTYDMLWLEAERSHPEHLDAIKRAGREKVDALLVEALDQQLAQPLIGNSPTPRSLFDLIKADLSS